MFEENFKEKNRFTFLTLALTGIFLLLTGLPLAGTSIGTVNNNTYPYLSFGAPLILLGLAMITIASIQRISQVKAQVAIGLCGQVLIGLIIFVIPSLPSFVFLKTFNFHTYSIVLGVLGIVLSLESIIVLSGIQKRTRQLVKSVTGNNSF
jgi:hypothetical protein